MLADRTWTAVNKMDISVPKDVQPSCSQDKRIGSCSAAEQSCGEQVQEAGTTNEVQATQSGVRQSGCKSWQLGGDPKNGSSKELPVREKRAG